MLKTEWVEIENEISDTLLKTAIFCYITQSLQAEFLPVYICMISLLTKVPRAPQFLSAWSV